MDKAYLRVVWAKESIWEEYFGKENNRKHLFYYK